MCNILCIETSASLCSVAIYTPTKIFYLENSKALAHAEFLAPLIQECLEKANLGANQLNAVAISGGPGSYTGLRIGCSTAKGLCFALNIPLIAIDTLAIIANAAIIAEPNYDYYWPMIDARRMEVYHTIFDYNLNSIIETTNSIIDETFLIEKDDLITNTSTSSITDENQKSKIINSKMGLCGDGAIKCADILKIPIINVVANAKAMCSLALAKYNSLQFEDTAYYEPFYLKQANITVSKNLMG